MVIGVQQTQSPRHNLNTKKTQEDTKLGVIVNSIVKDSINNNQNDLLRDYIIPSDSSTPEDLTPLETKETSNKSFMKLCLGTLGVLGGLGVATKVGNSIAEKEFGKAPKWNSLPDIGRNMNLNKESHFITYMLVQNPKIKNLVGAAAFFVFATTAFVLKNFADGFKDIWVKKQSAKADYTLQDNLIDVETRIFKGKNDIIRTMMQDTAKEMKEIIDNKNIPDKEIVENAPAFKGDFEKTENKKSEKENKIMPALFAVGTVIGAVLIGKYAFKNIQKTDKIIQENYDKKHKEVAEILEKSSDEILKKHENTLINLFSVMNFNPQTVKNQLERAKIPNEKIEKIVGEVEKRTARFEQAPKEMSANPGKIQYFTYIDDPSGHFYNWVMNRGSEASKPLGLLAMAISAVTGLEYAGEQAVNAMREAEVKKINNETELNLHKKLVNVELRNFKQKKESYIKPLMQEFKTQAPQKNKEQLDSMAQNILYEIKNGPPFVYA